MNGCERTRELLIMHYQAYPKLQIQDIFKFLYQSAFGCEHLVSSCETVTEYIQKEYDTITLNHVITAESVNGTGDSVTVEPLDGGYCRVPLFCLSQGLTANTLGRLFYLSSKKEKNGLSNLLEKLRIAQALVLENILPFSPVEFEKAVHDWEHNGYPAIHHSDIFRKTYNPSYRVISTAYLPFLPFLTELDRRLAKSPVKLAIEGGSASGKTTLSKLLADLYDCTVFHMDDFFLRPEQRTPDRYAEIGGNVDRERFLTEVLQPLSRNETIYYQRFDCSSMTLETAVPLVPKHLTVIEGAYAMHPELVTGYNFTIYLDISPELQKKRILRRNSAQMAERFFNEWIPLEQKYFSATAIKERCDLVIPI